MMVGRVSAEQAAPPAAPAAAWQGSVVNVTRFESWRFFEPQPGGGDPDYTFLGNRLRMAARRGWSRIEVNVAAQYVGLVGLPTRGSGPGALGTGALYFDQGGRRALNWRETPKRPRALQESVYGSESARPREREHEPRLRCSSAR
jgi:hypothetical protein